MRRRLAWLLALGAAVLALRALGRRERDRAADWAPRWPQPEPTSRPAEPGTDPRADELRRRLAESRELVEEREAFEEGELPVDRADPGPEERRRRIHDEARAAVDEIRGGDA
ncbi:MAG: hypothetical protein ICV64_08855 [Thermoleophilia bacterium]|nr:hypothetical protein [Thermoleophilia bacterium]